MNWLELIVGLIGGGGITTIVVALINKKKSPYDLYTEFIETQKEWMEARAAELEKEKADSAEKSYVIARSRYCKVKQQNPAINCPVEDANDIRLKNKCKQCPENKSSEN